MPLINTRKLGKTSVWGSGREVSVVREQRIEEEKLVRGGGTSKRIPWHGGRKTRRVRRPGGQHRVSRRQ